MALLLYHGGERHQAARALDASCNFGFRLHAHHAVDLTASVQDEQRGDPLDSETLCSLWVSIFNFASRTRPAIFLGQSIHDRSDDAAGTAPRRPQIEQYRNG